MGKYRVKAGDSLSKLAGGNSERLEKLIEANASHPNIKDRKRSDRRFGWLRIDECIEVPWITVDDLECPGAKPEKNSKVDKLDRAGTAHNPDENKPIDGRTNCPEEKKRYAHLALRIEFHQYAIRGRSQHLKLPVLANRRGNNADVFHTKKVSGFSDSNTDDKPRSPKKLYRNTSGTKFQGDLTTNVPLLMEPGTTVWQAGGGGKDWANDFLGQAFAIHHERDKTYGVTGTGKLRCSNLKTNSLAVANEKMAVQLYVYVRMKLNGKLGVYPVEKGEVKAQSISEEAYNKRKRLQHETETDEKWGSMPLMPGVQKIHALIQESGSAFKLAEVFCDGDQVFPE